MNRERTFDNDAMTAKPAFPSSAEVGGYIAQAKRLRSEVTAALLVAGFQRVDWSVRALAAGLARWHRQRQTRGALMRCSDRVLADIGIEREHIRLVAKGIDPAEYQLREPTLRRWWAAARDRIDAARAVRTEQRRLYRELDAYSDRELDEIGLRRADIPVIARGRPVFRRAA
jgi:uncharacterized protein YjiS (DUF1127 family)